jgi:hypothetical protein
MKHATQIIPELNHISLLSQVDLTVSLSRVFPPPHVRCLSLSLSRPLILFSFYFFIFFLLSSSADDTGPLPFFLLSSAQRLSPRYFPFSSLSITSLSEKSLSPLKALSSLDQSQSARLHPNLLDGGSPPPPYVVQ